MGKAALQAYRERRENPQRRSKPKRGPPIRDWLIVVPLEEPADAARPRRKIPINYGRSLLHDQIERLWVENDRLKREVARLELLLRRGTAYVLDKVDLLLDEVVR